MAFIDSTISEQAAQNAINNSHTHPNGVIERESTNTQVVSNNIALTETTELLGILSDGRQKNMSSLKTYDVTGTPFFQQEQGSTDTHYNINSIDRPTVEMRGHTDKETLAYQSDLMLVTQPRESRTVNGITLGCVSNNAVYSYFTGQSIITEEINLSPLDSIWLADDSDFPELQNYQGNSLLDRGMAIYIENDAYVTKEVFIMVDSSGIRIVNMNTTENFTLPVEAIFTFNKVLVLGN